MPLVGSWGNIGAAAGWRKHVHDIRRPQPIVSICAQHIGVLPYCPVVLVAKVSFRNFFFSMLAKFHTATFFLSNTACSDAYLDQDSVDVLCKDSCLSSLQNAKAVIAKACTTQTDIIVLDDIAYPGMLSYVFPIPTFTAGLTRDGLNSYLFRRQLHPVLRTCL